jgi:hypothetical protein
MFRIDGTPCCELFEIEMKHNHCCELLIESTHHPESAIICIPENQEYYVFLQGLNIQKNIIYCPWCASLQHKSSNKSSLSDTVRLEKQIFISDKMKAKKFTSDFCCETFDEAIRDNRFPLYYEAKDRNYFIGSGVLHLLYYCPWCAFKFPKDLRDEWCDILENEYKIDNPFSGDRRRIPKEFRSDEWWKKRGL